ncbi:unnamed protein product, partial [Callosobruchus maculatus]
ELLRVPEPLRLLRQVSIFC